MKWPAGRGLGSEGRRELSPSRSETDLLSLLPGLILAAPGSTLKAAAEAIGDWPAVAEAALEQGLTPLLFRRLSDICPGLVADDVFEELKTLYLVANERATRLTSTLVRIGELLSGDGISMVALKGPSLAQDLYGDIGLRGFADLDILVRAGDVARAHDLLLAEGFGRVQPGREVAIEMLLANEGELGVQQRDGGALVEVHWRVGWRLAQVSLPSEAILDEARHVELLGRPVGAPSVRDQVLILCVHGAHHAWDRLEMMVATVAAAERLAPGEWPALLDRARSFNNLRRVLVGVVLACETLGVTAPSEVRLRGAADPAVRGLVDEIRGAWQSGGGAVGARRRLRQITWLARTEDSAAAGARNLARRIVTPGFEDWDSARLPPRLSGLYYLWRPMRLTGKFARV